MLKIKESSCFVWQLKKVNWQNLNLVAVDDKARLKPTKLMKPHTPASSFVTRLPHVPYFRGATAARAAPPDPPHDAPGGLEFRRVSTAKRRRVSLSVCHATRVTAASNPGGSDGDGDTRARSSRRGVLMAPFLVAGASILLSAATARAEEKAAESPLASAPKPEEPPKKKEEEEVITSRIYDATVIGEPLAIGKEKGKIWEKLMNARVVYLGEAEQVPVRDDRELELEIVKNLHRRCLVKEKRLSLALEVFPANLQEPLNQYMDKKYNNAFQILINA